MAIITGAPKTRDMKNDLLHLEMKFRQKNSLIAEIIINHISTMLASLKDIKVPMERRDHRSFINITDAVQSKRLRLSGFVENE